MPKSKDLFDDATMSFGDHLEALRVHLFKALLGLIVAVIITLLFSDRIITIIRRPIDQALKKHYASQSDSITAQGEQLEELDFWETTWAEIKSWFGGPAPPGSTPDEPEAEELPPDTIMVEIAKDDILRLARDIDPRIELPEQPTPPVAATDEKSTAAPATVTIPMRSPAFVELRKAVESISRPITLNVQEAFMIYLKVALVSGLIFSFPWLFYQLWLFISAGLYEHERRYVYVFLPISMILFFGGAIFCYFAVFPYVLDFLLSFNAWLGITPQIRLSEWITFSLLLPLMFGVSFQLPLVMYFLDRMGLVSHQTFTEKRRMAILTISVLSMFLTPADPMSMILMMVPLLILYELGIIFCKMNPVKNPYEIATR